MHYFETAKIRPTRKDADRDRNVLAWDGKTWSNVHFANLMEDKEDDLANFYTHWMQMPKAPSKIVAQTPEE
ncbi:MAG: protein of unknown function DUF551 [Myoviridae sp. ctThM1]|nr:MAG: protein of unknown function DUF551 [Myoviridae sp. ctThM1]